MKSFKYYILFEDGVVRGSNQLIEIQGSKFYFELMNTGQKTYTTSFGNNYDVMKLTPVDIDGEDTTIPINELYTLKYFITSKMRYNAFNPVVDVCLLNLVTGKDFLIPSLFEFRSDLGALSLIDLYKSWDLTFDEMIRAKPADITVKLNEKMDCLRTNLTGDFDKMLSELRGVFWFNTAKRLRELVKEIKDTSDDNEDVVG